MYESKADITNEGRVASQVGLATKAVMKKNPKAYPIDWCAYKGGKIAGWVEIKCRKNPKDQYPTLMLSYNKLVSGKRYAEVSGAPFLLVIEWTDGVYFWKCPDDVTGYSVTNGGRTDRGDSQDLEPVVLIPTSEFKKLAAQQK